MENLQQICDQRKNEILLSPSMPLRSGAVYYVSAAGDDANDGLSPETAWKTPEKVTNASLKPHDNVLFRRGDLFRGSFCAQAGVMYSAYGEGEKPRFYGFDYDLAEENLWEIFDKEKRIWRLKKEIPDCGTLVFDEGKCCSRKLIPSFIGGRFVCREDETRPFCIADEMTENLDLFCHVLGEMTEKPSKGASFPIPNLKGDSVGVLYLRCDAGNPGKVFSSIEALPRRHMIHVGTCDNVHIDNLCLKYIGMHAVKGGRQVKGLHVTNCEIGWVGGCIQHYLGTDPNYPEGGRGTVTRFGNGVEIYGGCENYRVENCWIYQVYDAAITHQITTNGQIFRMENIRYRRNLIEDCVYGIEYFLEKTQGDTLSFMADIDISHNILRRSGYGWGQQRHNKHTPALIKGWNFENTAHDFAIHHNVFDRCAYRLLHLVAQEKESLPRLDHNIYIQYASGCLGQYGANEKEAVPTLAFDKNAESIIRSVWGDEHAEIYYIEE